MRVARIILFSIIVGAIFTINSNAKAATAAECDLNGDNVVDMLDIAMIATYYNTANAGFDINEDGYVNLYDLVTVAQYNGQSVSSTVNMIFIHHSTGAGWLTSGNLDDELNSSDYHVADTYYGWGPDSIGDHTDTRNWPDWFDTENDVYMSAVYAEMDTVSATNTIDPAVGENQIVMFKSCYPCSEVGASIDDEKAVYNSLLPYFAAHTDKMFVLIVPPPEISISSATLTRELANWLVLEYGVDYRDDVTTPANLYVFDYYSVLTHPDNHHYMLNGVETHTIGNSQNELYYYTGGDSHPIAAGHQKATAEFVPLLNYWYGEYSDS